MIHKQLILSIIKKNTQQNKAETASFRLKKKKNSLFCLFGMWCVFLSVKSYVKAQFCIRAITIERERKEARCLATERNLLDKRIWQPRERERERKVNACIHLHAYIYLRVYKYLWPSFYLVFLLSVFFFFFLSRSGRVQRERERESAGWAARWFFLHDRRERERDEG